MVGGEEYETKVKRATGAKPTLSSRPEKKGSVFTASCWARE